MKFPITFKSVCAVVSSENCVRLQLSESVSELDWTFPPSSHSSTPGA